MGSYLVHLLFIVFSSLCYPASYCPVLIKMVKFLTTVLNLPYFPDLNYSMYTKVFAFQYSFC